MAGPGDLSEWATLRQLLWPDEDRATHEAALRELLRGDKFAGFVARTADNEPIGFAEATIRTDWVNGCDTSPVLFLEGLFVTSSARRRGVARDLVEAVAIWGRAKDATEFASDAPLDNEASHAMHRALGFAETERVLFFRRELAPGA
jgi:aminoglycoside 6'-N-acetyltransferase I